MVRIYKVWTDERCPEGEEETYIDEEKLANSSGRRTTFPKNGSWKA